MSLPNIKYLGPEGVSDYILSKGLDSPEAPKVVHLATDNTSFVKMEKVSTVAAISSDITLKQMKVNIKRKLPRLHQLSEFKQIKNEPIALVGGGPSLKETKEELKKYKNIMVCGSAHDYLLKQNTIPTYAVFCDPDAISANYLTTPDKRVNYLISSGCDNAVYDALQGCKIIQWHCYSDDYIKHQAELEEEFQAVGGGCTVGLRSISIALMLGYSDIHFFGFDSCLGVDKEHHAYGFTNEEKEQLGEIYPVRLGFDEKINTEKIFYCAGYQLAQCSHFKDFYTTYHRYFTPTFHGEGLLTEVMKTIITERDKLAKEQGITIENKTKYELTGLLTKSMSQTI